MRSSVLNLCCFQSKIPLIELIVQWIFIFFSGPFYFVFTFRLNFHQTFVTFDLSLIYDVHWIQLKYLKRAKTYFSVKNKHFALDRENREEVWG